MLIQEQAKLKGELQLQSMVDAIHKAATENQFIDQVELDTGNFMVIKGNQLTKILISPNLQQVVLVSSDEIQ